MTATRAALLGGGYGGASGGVVGGGIAQLFFGYDTHVLPLLVAAFILAIHGHMLGGLHPARRQPAKANPMKTTKKCSKCGSSDILRIPGPQPFGGFWTAVKVSRYVCASCGFIEDWIDEKKDMAKLKK